MKLQQQNEERELEATSVTANDAVMLQTGSSTATNEELLQRLAVVVKARRRARNLLKGLYCGSFGLYTIFVFYICFNLSTRAGSLWQLYPALMGIMFGLYLLNAAFYRRFGPVLQETILPLAERGEERAVGPLLELMDMRASGVTGWKKSRPLFVQAITTLVSGLTPLGFQSLTDMQVHQMTPLIMMPESDLSAAVRDMFVRCGDARALRALRRIRTVYKVQKAQKWNPMMTPMIRLMHKFKMPTLDTDTMEYVDQCCNAIQARINAESSDVQLLRASDGNAVGTPEQLLRPTLPTTSDVNSDDLVRASLDSDGPGSQGKGES